MAMLMSFGMSAFAGTKTVNTSVENVAGISIPVNLTVKQTITFNDGKTITVYYQKEGDVCKAFSKDDVSKYKESDLNRIKSTNFEVTDHVEGKCLITKKTSDVIAFAKSLKIFSGGK